LQRGVGGSLRDSLKHPGCISVISTVTRAYRAAKGILSLCADCLLYSTILVAHSAIARVESSPTARKRLFKELPTQVRVEFRAIAVDIRDIVWGIVEMVPVAGNLTCIAYDKLSDWYLARRDLIHVH